MFTRRYWFSALLIVTAAAPLARAQGGMSDPSWMLEYKGKQSKDLLQDDRLPQLLSAKFGPDPVLWGKQSVQEAAEHSLSAPGTFEIVQDRYAVVTGSDAKAPAAKALIWADTGVSPKRVIAVFLHPESGGAQLWVVSTHGDSPGQLPTELREQLAQWTQGQKIQVAFLVSATGAKQAVSPQALGIPAGR